MNRNTNGYNFIVKKNILKKGRVLGKLGWGLVDWCTFYKTEKFTHVYSIKYGFC